SARMAADAGCTYAIVGHSERRRLFGEDGPLLSRKLAQCRDAGLTPIYCVGETADERDAGKMADGLGSQLATLARDPAGGPRPGRWERAAPHRPTTASPPAPTLRGSCPRGHACASSTAAP